MMTIGDDLNALDKVHVCGSCGTDIDCQRDWEGVSQLMVHEKVVFEPWS